MRQAPALSKKSSPPFHRKAGDFFHRTLCLLPLLAALPADTAAQLPGDHGETAGGQGEEFTIVSYNVENLFHPTDDPLRDDDEFLPTGARGWGWGKYRKKLTAIGRAIMACGKELPPALVGLCETEGDSVLFYLTRRSLLRTADYRYVAASTSDPRGTCTALLYQRDRFRLLHSESFPTRLPSGEILPSRHTLHACGLIETGDTLDVFVVHFPSRRDGKQATDPLRRAAAHTLKEKIDSIAQRRVQPLIVAMGDFNEYPGTQLFSETLQTLIPPAPALPEGCDIARKHRRKMARNQAPIREEGLYDLAAPLEHSQPGTYKYQGTWGVLDHILVSGRMLAGKDPLHVPARCAEPGAFPFLLQRDEKYLGLRPYRTYYGYQYQEEGTSDHLPLIVRAFLKPGT